MGILKKYKTILIIVGVLILGFIGYNFFVVDENNTENEALTSESVATADASGGELLVLLNTLKGIELETTFFQDRTFRSLIDFSVDIRPEPVGRTNPFAPIGTSNVVIPTEEE